MIAVFQDDMDEIRKTWEYCGFPISEKEVFEILEGKA